jgi:predicted HTH transcriptional regulator
MTPDELTQLIANGETLTVEFKSDSARLGDTDLLEAVVCLANTSGGTLLIGVENKFSASGCKCFTVGEYIDIAINNKCSHHQE